VEPFPEDVARFVFEYVESIDQLEILRLLGEDGAREWDCLALAGEVQAELQAVRKHLAAMSARGLLTTESRDSSLVCRHGACTAELETMVGRLLQLYKERPVTLIKMVYDRARDPLQAFADAFRLRKHE
jgi:hypothetical protein